MYRRLLIICLLIPLAAAAADVPAPYDYGDPTAEEQVVLERINAIRIGEGLQPLAMEARLLAAARAHSSDMAARLFFEHANPDGRKPNGRLIDAGYPLPEIFKEVGKTLEESNTVENIAARTPPDPQAILDNLMTSQFHRNNILSIGKPAGVDQAGIGITTLGKWVKIGESKLQQFMTQEFARDDDLTPHLLGVVYEDRNGNGLYDVGEGLSGVTVATTSGGYTTTTATAGGFGIPVDQAGNYTLRASGGALPEAMDMPVTIGAENVKVDFTADLPETFDLVKSTIKVDFKKRLKAKTNVDSLKVKLMVDPDRLPANLDGVTATVKFGALTYGPYTLTGSEKKGKYKTLSGVIPKVVLDIRRKKGKVTFEVKKGDLMDDLGIANETAAGTRGYEVTLTIGSAFEAPGSIDHAYTSTQDKKAKFTALP